MKPANRRGALQPNHPVSLARRRLLQAGLSAPALAALGCVPEHRVAGYGHSTQAGAWANWSGGQTSRPAHYLAPRTEGELARALRGAAGPVRPVGASHSFSAVAASDGTMVSLDRLSGLVAHDARRQQATLWAGTRIRDAGEPLWDAGQALLNQGDVDPQSLAGAAGTSTHGTGITLGSFSSVVRGLRLVTPQGEVIECSADQDADVFFAACTSVGALGVVSQLTLQNRSAYHLRERVFTAPLAEILRDAEKLRDTHRHFEFWAFFESDTALVKILDETAEPPTAPPAVNLPVDSILWLACEVAHGAPALDGAVQKLLMAITPGEERVDRSYRIFPSPREVRFNEMEYELPAAHGPACLEELLATVKQAGINTLFPVEYRYVAADECWLSPFYRRGSVSISVHQYHRIDHRPLFAVAEPVLRKHGGRPHWGKLHTLTAKELAPLYPRWDDFHAVRRRLDPQGKMLNPHLRQVFET